jgi:chromosome partitioning protein
MINVGNKVNCMGKIVAVVNQKGGVGKTTTSINLSASLGILGKKVLIVDLDPQGNATTGVGVDKGSIDNSIYEVLVKKCDIKSAIIKTKSKNLSIIPAYLNLAGVEMELIELERIYREKGERLNRVSRLKEELSLVSDKYDYIIIDCPPSLGILTTNALCAANSVLIPVQCEYFALEGIMQLINTIMLAQKKVNPDLDIEGVLLTMLTSNTNLGLEVVESIKGFFKERVYDTIIPRLIRLAEAPSHGKPILEYEPRSRGTLAYLNLAKEVIARNGTKEESVR